MKKTILFTLSSPSKDSAIKTAEICTLEQLKNEYKIRIISYGDFYFNNIISALKKLYKSVKDISAIKYDLLHVNTAYDKKAVIRDFIFLLLLKKNGKIFFKYHGSKPFIAKNIIFRFFTRVIIRRIDGFGFLSNDEMLQYKKWFINDRKYYIIKNSVKDGKFISKSSSVFRILFIGRVIKTKGILDLIQSIDLLNIDKNNLHVDIIGDGELLNNIKNMCTNIECIEVHGRISEFDALKYYKNCDLLVLPTYHDEGLPNVVLKSLSFGKPIITTRIRGMKHYLNDENAIFVKRESPSEIARAIEKLYNDYSFRKKIAMNNFKLAPIFYAQNVAREYNAIYRKVISNE